MKYLVLSLLVGLVAMGVLSLLREEPAPAPVAPTDLESSAAEVAAPPVAEPDVTDSGAEEVEIAIEPDGATAVSITGDALADALFAAIALLVTGTAEQREARDLVGEIVKTTDRLDIGPYERREQECQKLLTGMEQEIAAVRPRDAAPLALEGALKQRLTQVAIDAAKRLREALANNSGGATHDGLRFVGPAIDDLEIPAGFTRVKWKALGGFTYKEGMTLPDEVTALHQKKVAMTGYMMSLGDFENIHEFLLVESQWSCCFGVPPDVNQVIVVRIPEDRLGIDLITMPILVLGTLDVGEEVQDGWVTSVYRLVAETVEEID